MEFIKLFTALAMWMLDSTGGESVFTRSDLGDLVTSFDGTGCPGDTREPVPKRYYRYLQQSRKNPRILYVGAMNNLYKLEMPLLQCMNYTESVPNSLTQNRCSIQGKVLTPDCQNHIRVVMEINDHLLVCGTGAYSPKLYTLNDHLEINTTDNNGEAYCPYDPMDNYTAILVTDGNPCNATLPYFGTYSDFIKSQPVFFRPNFSCPSTGEVHARKTTDHEDINWFNSPQFVGSFEDSEKVLFFFRETAVEAPAEKKRIYSRVGKVCKMDLGGGYLDIATKMKWLSFQKTRLVCSVAGDTPYYYDEIYDVYQSGDQFYALFYRHTGVDSSGGKYSHIVASSAVCAYKKEDIETVFEGKFQYRASQDNWETLPNQDDPNPRLDNCTAHRDNPAIFKDKVSQYQLMADNVLGMFLQPIFYKADTQFIKIAVSETKTHEQTTARNIYLASNEGEVYDVFFKTFGADAAIPFITANSPTIYRPFGLEKNTDYAVWNMKYVGGTLLMGTDYEVTRVDIGSLCSSIQKIDICIVNTNCKWSRCTKECVKSDFEAINCTDFLDWTVITSDGVLESLENEIDTSSVELKVVGEGLYTTLPLFSIQVHVDNLIWVKSTDCNGVNVLDENKEKYAVTSSGSLIIKNLKSEDNNTNFTACGLSRSRVKLKTYRVTVSEGNEQIIEVWKQQFNDWSSAFVKWKGCADDYLDVCTRP